MRPMKKNAGDKLYEPRPHPKAGRRWDQAGTLFEIHASMFIGISRLRAKNFIATAALLRSALA